MSERTVKRLVRGFPAVDGAGVHLVRVLGHETVKDFDPFLMLDSFDSANPEDYIAGFPMHPHRGIETITYLIRGEIDHEDSLGNAGRIRDGQSQWMTAGSGILHQEMPQPTERLLGAQLWLNLPAAEKMAEPRYFDITKNMIGEKQTADATVRVLAGEYGDVKGAKPYHIQATYYDVAVKPGKSITIDTKAGETVFIFLIEGDAVITGDRIPEKTAVLFGEGDRITAAAPKDGPSRFLFLSGKPLGEEIAWGGPIVMNTRTELFKAFQELEEGTFIKHKAAPPKEN
ncbi:pirin family protein [Breznakiella homolactica]|uniref:Pirin family protein n=1 Tax=Breznakiella homolactica TaxID=2798577 RepID=A0A7T7XM10_9SPIR|nr:pirin family protein [Breznakiella homolactica]QQO08851.1 pirin family protein [Breznakiella homolactica]